MLREIRAAPERVEVMMERETAPLERALARFRRQRPPLIFVAGRGTSHHAAIFAHYLFERFLATPVSGAALSLFTLYPAPLNLKGALAIGISQSGESTDVVKALRSARRMGAFTVAVTNTSGSSLTKVADHSLLLHCQKERAVAATKTYVASLVGMVMIARALGADFGASEVEGIPDAIRSALSCEDAIREVAPYYRYATACICLARGFNYCTVRETALKLQETCYLGASGMSAADFLHGPIAMLSETTPLVTFAADGPTYPFMLKLVQDLRRQDADILTFSNRERITKLSTPGRAGMGIHCAFELREGLSPIPFATLGQLLACHVALTRGNNPDAPRRLRKVTRTL
jgi:glucosamine--fructose-6-phosphate aminotransferase (isomerizing)